MLLHWLLFQNMPKQQAKNSRAGIPLNAPFNVFVTQLVIFLQSFVCQLSRISLEETFVNLPVLLSSRSKLNKSLFAGVLGIPKKYKRSIHYRTEGFCSVIKLSFYFNKKHSDFETKFVQILYELTEIHKFRNRQVDFYFQDFANFRDINFHNACTLNNMLL